MGVGPLNMQCGLAVKASKFCTCNIFSFDAAEILEGQAWTKIKEAKDNILVAVHVQFAIREGKGGQMPNNNNNNNNNNTRGQNQLPKVLLTFLISEKSPHP